MLKIITYRISGTGRWGYGFYGPDRRRIGSVSAAVSYSAPVSIEGGGVSWYSRFGMDVPVVPGTGRRVWDNRTGQEVYRIIYWQPGIYEVVPAAGEPVQVEIRSGTYLFGRPKMPVTAMAERISEADWVPPGNRDIRPVFLTTVFGDVGEAYLMMVLSFPSLRFY